MMTEAKYKKSYFVWAAICAFYCGFIALFSYLYPYGGDEYALSAKTFGDAVAIFLTSYLVRNPRIGLLFNNVILFFGKWLFVLINPLVQLSMVFAIFFFVFLRLPDFKSTKDIAAFSFIALLSVFAVAVPDNTLFWIGGACNYSWMFLVFILFLCLLRYAAQKGLNFKITFGFKLLLFFGGIVGGMSSENASPMLLIIFCGYWLYARVKKIKLAPWFYCALGGIILGLILLFCAPGSYYRLKTLPLEYIKNATLAQKAFWHLPRLNAYFADVLFVPLIAAALFVFAAADNFKTAIKNADFILGALMCAVSFGLAAALFPVPLLLQRVFYGSSVAAIIALLFGIKYFEERYKIKLFRYLSLLSLCAALVVAPLFALPYGDLYCKHKSRIALIEQAKQEGKNSVFIPPLYTVKGPLENLSLNYYDFVFLNNYDKQLIFGIDIESGAKPKLLPMATPSI